MAVIAYVLGERTLNWKVNIFY